MSRAHSITASIVLLLLSACSVPAAALKEHPLTEKVRAGIESGKQSFDHSAFDKLLAAHAGADGRVDYAALKPERAKLDAYLRSVAAADLATLSREELLAFLINAYNAYTLALILDHYPVASIRELPGIGDPWKVEFCALGGGKVDLNFIEHNLLRVKELFDEPRIHFAINCAAISCPPLRPHAYAGKDIGDQLEASTKAALADPRYLSVRGEKIEVTKILDWFGVDFKNKFGSVAKFLIPRVSKEAAAILEKSGDAALEFKSYDWKLNDRVR